MFYYGNIDFSVRDIIKKIWGHALRCSVEVRIKNVSMGHPKGEKTHCQKIEGLVEGDGGGVRRLV